MNIHSYECSKVHSSVCMCVCIKLQAWLQFILNRFQSKLFKFVLKLFHVDYLTKLQNLFRWICRLSCRKAKQNVWYKAWKWEGGCQRSSVGVKNRPIDVSQFHDGDYLTPVPQYLQSRSDYDKALLTRTWLSSRANEDVPRTIPIF